MAKLESMWNCSTFIKTWIWKMSRYLIHHVNCRHVRFFFRERFILQCAFVFDFYVCNFVMRMKMVLGSLRAYCTKYHHSQIDVALFGVCHTFLIRWCPKSFLHLINIEFDLGDLSRTPKTKRTPTSKCNENSQNLMEWWGKNVKSIETTTFDVHSKWPKAK